MARDFVKLPKVLFKYPLARDPRIITKWYSGKTIEDSRVQWVAPLTGNPDVSLKWMYPRFKIPWDRIMRQEPRPPTALDMNLLFRLFHILERPEQYKNPRKPIHVEGNIIRVSKFSRLLPKTTSDIFSKRARDTYRLWCLLGVRFPYPDNLDMPPPIEYIEGEDWRKPLAIHINKKWIDEIKRGRHIVHPLPINAVAQNIVLITWYYGNRDNIDINDWFYKVSGNKRGLKSTPHTPYESWVVVKQWYKSIGGEIAWQRDPYQLGISRRKRVKHIPSRKMHIRVIRQKTGPNARNLKLGLDPLAQISLKLNPEDPSQHG